MLRLGQLITQIRRITPQTTRPRPSRPPRTTRSSNSRTMQFCSKSSSNTDNSCIKEKCALPTSSKCYQLAGINISKMIAICRHNVPTSKFPCGSTHTQLCPKTKQLSPLAKISSTCQQASNKSTRLMYGLVARTITIIKMESLTLLRGSSSRGLQVGGVEQIRDQTRQQIWKIKLQAPPFLPNIAKDKT